MELVQSRRRPDAWGEKEALAGLAGGALLGEDGKSLTETWEENALRTGQVSGR